MITVEQEVKAKFQKRNPWLKPTEIDHLYDTAVFVYKKLRSPFNANIEVEPSNAAWIEMAMKEFLDRDGGTEIAYAENGISRTYDASMLSNGLRSLLIAKPKIPKRSSK